MMRKGRPCSPEVASAAKPPGAVTTDLPRGAWPLPGDACESWARALQLHAHNLGVKETAADLEPRKSCRWSGAARGAERLKHVHGRSSTASVRLSTGCTDCFASRHCLYENRCAAVNSSAGTSRAAAPIDPNGRQSGAYQVPPDHTPLSRGNQEFFAT